MKSAMSDRESELVARVGQVDWFDLAEVVVKVRDHGPWQSNGDCMWCDVWPHSVGGPVTHAPGCLWLEVVAATNPPEQEGPS